MDLQQTETVETAEDKPGCASVNGYARYVTDFEIIRDKIASIRLHFIPTDDHRAMAIEAELWLAQQRMEDAIRHAHNGEVSQDAGRKDNNAK